MHIVLGILLLRCVECAGGILVLRYVYCSGYTGDQICMMCWIYWCFDTDIALGKLVLLYVYFA